MAKRTTTAKKPQVMVYIGRSLTGLPSNTVFIGGALPRHVAEMAAANPHLAALIVPVNELQAARRNIATKGHLLHFHATHLTDKEM